MKIIVEEFPRDDLYLGDLRTSPELINLVETTDRYSGWKVIEIPDDATDYDILEYGGSDMVICVVDGKIKYLF